MKPRELPSLEEPEPGACCPTCGEPERIRGFCASCFEGGLEVEALHEEAIRADWREARRRTRNRTALKTVQS